MTTITAKNLISTDKMPLLEANINRFKPLFSTSLLRYMQESKKPSSSCQQRSPRPKGETIMLVI